MEWSGYFGMSDSHNPHAKANDGEGEKCAQAHEFHEKHYVEEGCQKCDETADDNGRNVRRSKT